jgi:hypothetical protein
MTELLEQAIARVRALPLEVQDDFAQVLLQLTAAPETYVLTGDEEADLDQADAEIARGEFASDAEVRSVRRKHGL